MLGELVGEAVVQVVRVSSSVRRVSAAASCRARSRTSPVRSLSRARSDSAARDQGTTRKLLPSRVVEDHRRATCTSESGTRALERTE